MGADHRARTLSVGPHERITIVNETPELLELEATYDPGGSPPPSHYHPAQDEHFEVLAGTVRCRVFDEERELGTGGTIDVPRGVAHQFWNAGSEPARVRWEVRPALRTATFFERIAGSRTPFGKLAAVLRHRREIRLVWPSRG
jgi:quercetin dioxygenase-like cupin family protein